MLPPGTTTEVREDHHVRGPWLWAALLVTSIGLAAQLVDGVREQGDLSAFDPRVTDGVVHVRTAAITRVARAFTFLGSTVSLVTLTVLLIAAILIRRHDRRLAGLVGAAMTASAALTVVAKHLVARTRPTAASVLGRVDTGYAFPSGHTLNSTVFFGLVAGLLFARTRPTGTRALIVATWLSASAAVAASRVYLGYHWLSDVLGGFALGLGVLALVALVATWLDLPLWARPSAPSGRELL